jgi:hypothetical protein
MATTLRDVRLVIYTAGSLRTAVSAVRALRVTFIQAIGALGIVAKSHSDFGLGTDAGKIS